MSGTSCRSASTSSTSSTRSTPSTAVAAAASLLAELRSDPYGWISLSVYESARLVTVAPWLAGHRQRLRYLMHQQTRQGWWPGPGEYALVPTLSATEAALACLDESVGDRAPSLGPLRGAVIATAAAGLRALAERLRPGQQAPIPDTVAVELLVPALISDINARLARLAGRFGSDGPPWPVTELVVPPGMDAALLARLRAAVAGGQALPEKLAHSLEIFDGVAGASFVRPMGGSVACSPAATAAWLGPPGDRADGHGCTAYLERVQARSDGPVPICAPVPVFERSWVLATFATAGVPGAAPPKVLDELAAAVGVDGVSAGGGLAPDADTTSTVLYALARHGRPHDPACLWSFRAGDHFTSFPAERTVSTTTNAHVLQALGEWVEGGHGPRDRYRAAAEGVSRWLCARQAPSGEWTDKWHSSPYYATVCVCVALADHGGTAAAGALRRAVDWVLDTQRPDGSWGRWSGTAEETAYAVQILLRADAAAVDPVRAEAAARGVRFLLRDGLSSALRADHPPLWHDKDLYTPVRVVRAALIAALHLADSSPEVARFVAAAGGD